MSILSMLAGLFQRGSRPQPYVSPEEGDEDVGDDGASPIGGDPDATLPLPVARRQTLGVRNNNPGNIRYSDQITWRGQVGQASGFVRFDTPLNGIRALATVLRTYERKYGLRTVRGIITRWAPPSENDTAAYIRAVASAMTVSADQPLDTGDFLDLAGLTHAIIHHENGYHPYTDAQVRDGVLAALGS